MRLLRLCQGCVPPHCGKSNKLNFGQQVFLAFLKSQQLRTKYLCDVSLPHQYIWNSILSHFPTIWTWTCRVPSLNCPLSAFIQICYWIFVLFFNTNFACNLAWAPKHLMNPPLLSSPLHTLLWRVESCSMMLLSTTLQKHTFLRNSSYGLYLPDQIQGTYVHSSCFSSMSVQTVLLTAPPTVIFPLPIS